MKQKFMTKPTILTLAVAMLTAISVNAHELSARANVGVGEDVLIGGLIVEDRDCPQNDDGSRESATFVIRALGPSLASAGVQNVLLNPQIEFYDADGNLIGGQRDYTENDIATQQEIFAHGLAPSDSAECALLIRLLPGTYTAIVSGENETTGVAILEAYKF